MLIIAVIVAVSIGITKAKLDNIISYTYYNAYSTLRKISTEMLADWDPKDPEYKQQVSNLDKSMFVDSQTSKLALGDSFLKSVLELPNDHRFFSTLISHIPFSIKLIPENVKAGSTVTVYGCPASAKYYSSTGGGAKENTDSYLDYYVGTGRCEGSTMHSVLSGDGYLKCPGKYKNLSTYAQKHASSSSHPYYYCTYECSTLEFCSSFHMDPTGTCKCGLKATDYYNISCSGVSKMFSNSVYGSGDGKYIGDVSISNATVVSSTLTTGNVCKIQIQCKDGYYWESKGTNNGYPVGSCRTCSKTCSGGFTLNKSTCSCECKKSCPEGYKLSASSCTCVKDGAGACNKTCTSSGQKLDTTACACYVDCWDGSKKEYSWQCPSKVTCWDGSFATSKDKCPACDNKPTNIPCGYKWDDTNCKLTGSDKKCYGSRQKLDPKTCECYIECWDGSRAEYSFECPSKVTCWDGSYAHNKSECPPCNNKPAVIPCGQSWDSANCKLTGSPKKCYSSGQKLDPNTCECYVECWDGTKAEYSFQCPLQYTCWDGSIVHNSSECPACTKTCSSGYYLDSSSCTCKKIQVTCWDGTKADTYSECPDFVTCWNGNKAHNYGECPPCPNKPRCPAGNWSDITCSGDSKTCPVGQHLNSVCGCVNDCPSAEELTPCRLYSNETGEITKNPDINRTCSDETYEWSEEQCKCIISPRTLPRKGMNFCKLFERHSNIMGNTDVCAGTVITDGTTNFADKKPDISLRNGIRLYNMHRDATALAVLAGNTQGGVYDGVPNTNEWGYTVYVDIDGIKGDSQLWSDVYPFYITLSGKIIPAYDSANPGVSGGDSTRHLQVSIEYEDYTSGNRRIKWLAKSVPFKEGACLSGYIGSATPYCKNNTAINKLSECTTDGNSLCRLKQIQPVKFFF